MYVETKCPHCGGTLNESENGDYWYCENCRDVFTEDDGEFIESISNDDDFELANFCHGGDLTED